jgi:hypothetical protein
MNRYRLLPERLPQIESYLKRQFIFVGAGIVFGLMLPNLAPLVETRVSFWIGMVLIFGIIAWALGGFWLRASLKAQRKCWPSYELEVTDSYLRRAQVDLEPLQINFPDIRQISESGRHGLIIYGKGGQCIYIPNQLERYGEVRAMLTVHKPVTAYNFWRTPFTIVFIYFLALPMFVTSANPYSVILLGVVLSGTMIVSFQLIRTNPNLSEKVKSSKWSYLLIALVCLARVGYKVAEFYH